LSVMESLSMKTDHELVVLYENGNNEAFDVLLSRYQEYLYSYILFLVHSQDNADDVFQETFARAIAAMRNHRYQTTGKFGAWLVRIAHNIIIDQTRLDGGNRFRSNDEFPQTLSNSLKHSQQSEEHDIIEKQKIDTINDLLDYLPENQREVVVLRYYEDLSFKEIAEKTGVSINTALGRMRYALINLRRLIQQYQLSLVG